MPRLLDFDPLTGIRTTFDYDYASDTTHIIYDDPTGVTDKVLDWNRERKADIQKNTLQGKRDFVHYARVPPMAQLDMLSRHGVKFWDKNHRKKVMSLLNTSEYADCRISHKLHDR